MAGPAPRFFFGAMSPYSWFAAERIGVLIPAARWRPVFAGALFKANGRSTWGLGARRRAGIADCDARAARHGLGPIRWPEPWPTNDVLVARAMAFAEREGVLEQFALASMRAAFLEGGDLADAGILESVARRVGLDPELLARALAHSEIKDIVRATHEEAMSLGVFGVPTVVLGAQLFWGDDRLEEAARAGESNGTMS
jgi:2-hydroxychromene-2-carboxylate isomerase